MTYWWHERSWLVCVENSRSGRVTLYAAARTLHEATPTCTIYNFTSNGQGRRIMQLQSDKTQSWIGSRPSLFSPSFCLQSVQDPVRISAITPTCTCVWYAFDSENTVILLSRLVNSRKQHATCVLCGYTINVRQGVWKSMLKHVLVQCHARLLLHVWPVWLFGPAKRIWKSTSIF